VARPSTNRIFQDEINAAKVLDLGNAALPNYTWPERLSDARPNPVVTHRVSAPYVRLAITNRIFLDEIAGAQAMNSEATIPSLGGLELLHGPR
jgi:hypothetical protein